MTPIHHPRMYCVMTPEGGVGHVRRGVRVTCRGGCGSCEGHVRRGGGRVQGGVASIKHLQEEGAAGADVKPTIHQCCQQ